METIIPILSICIPTYNRAEILRKNLLGIASQLNRINIQELELIISDNCSTDHTSEVVKDIQELGISLLYIRNEHNLGPDGNFLQCMRMAKGKYVFLLGDDDFLSENAICDLLNVLRGKDYGLIYIDTQGDFKGYVKEVCCRTDFIKHISFFYTYMSSCIFRRLVVERVQNPERYLSTHLLQMPFYLCSTYMKTTNAIIGFPIIKLVGADAKNIGGFNFFEVFVCNYLTICGEYIKDCNLYKYLKKDLWVRFVWGFSKKILIRKDVRNYKKDNGWKILFKYYGNEWYFWWSLFSSPILIVYKRLSKLIKA